MPMVQCHLRRSKRRPVPHKRPEEAHDVLAWPSIQTKHTLTFKWRQLLDGTLQLGASAPGLGPEVDQVRLFMSGQAVPRQIR